MPTNHGICRRRIEDPPSEYRRGPEDVGVFRNGIHQIFMALKTPAVTPNHSDQKKAVQLEFHYRETTRRLVFSLQHLNTLMQEMAAEYNRDATPSLNLALELEAGCQADHILTYLSSIVDDVACAIIQATGYVSPNPTKPVDSMGGLKTLTTNATSPPALGPVRSLVAELDNAGSWWELAFKPRVGGRQLLIHNHYYVTFQGAAAEGQPFEVEAFLMTPFAQAPLPHFFDLLRGIFAGLFEWLDRLEATLTAHLSAKSGWLPDARCPSFTLPVGYPPGTTHFHPGYFVLPLCNDSDPLPWTTTVSSG
jgi:hypothetical protein